MGIEELPPICRTPRLDELEAEGQATTAEIQHHRFDLPLGTTPSISSDDNVSPLTARSAPADSQSIMHEMEELPFQHSRQEALHPGAMTPGAQKIAAAAAQSETPASRRLNFHSNFGSGALDNSVMEGHDGALYLSPSDGSGMGMGVGPSNTRRSHEPQMVLELEEGAFPSLNGARSQPSSLGPSSTAMQPVVAPSHANERAGTQMYSSQHPLPDADLSSPADNLLNQQPTETHPSVIPDGAGFHERQPQPMLKTEVQIGPPSAASPPDSGAGFADDQGFARFPRNPYMQRTASTNQKLHTAPAASEQESFAGKATEQWQSTRPGRGRDTAAARRAQMAGDQGNKRGGVRKMLRSASDACKRLAEAATVTTRESRRQRSKSQAPTTTSPTTLGSAPSRNRRATQNGGSSAKATTNTVGAGRLGSGMPTRGAATMGNAGSKVPGSVEIRMQQRAMRQFNKNTTRTGRTGRAVTAREGPADKDKERGSVRGRGSVSARASSSVQRRTSSVSARPVRLVFTYCLAHDVLCVTRLIFLQLVTCCLLPK